jgi:hypothetical protein
MSATAAEWVSTTQVELGTAAQPALVRWCTWRIGGSGTSDSYALRTRDGAGISAGTPTTRSSRAGSWTDGASCG